MEPHTQDMLSAIDKFVKVEEVNARLNEWNLGVLTDHLKAISKHLKGDTMLDPNFPRALAIIDQVIEGNAVIRDYSSQEKSDEEWSPPDINGHTYPIQNNRRVEHNINIIQYPKIETPCPF